MSDPTPIFNLEDVQCWICLEPNKGTWARGTILCAWYETSHGPPEGCEDVEAGDCWRVYPTVLATVDKSGDQWIMQLPNADIAFCNDPDPNWIIDGEE